jgi:tRNA-splicing endonuclease subunit Sen54
MPKRGEKEFEPRANGGTNLQLHILDRARSAMFEALRSARTISRQRFHNIRVTLHTDIIF